MDPSPTSETEAKPYRILLYAAIGFLVFWFGYLTFFGPKQHRPARRLRNERARRRTTGPSLDLNDQPVAFSKFKGKPVFLNFWATWCGPCVREMPSIDTLARDPRLAGKSIEFVCISVDDDAETVRQLRERKELWHDVLASQRRKDPARILVGRNPRHVPDCRRRPDRRHRSRIGRLARAARRRVHGEARGQAISGTLCIKAGAAP